MAAPVASAQPAPGGPPDFVSLTDVDGYRAPLCLLARPAAEALGHAQREFLEQGYSLLLKDGLEKQGFENYENE